MPDRWLREGFLRSATLQDLPCATREFYVRLLLLVDDFGCYDGRTNVVATQAYPTCYSENVPDIEAMLRELHRAELIVRYSNRGRPYVAITQWLCGIRGWRKFPAPPLDVDLPVRHKVRGQYGRPIGWWNPIGSDDVSILLDLEGRATVPQPAEWRPPNHYLPVTGGRNDYLPVTTDQSLHGHVAAPRSHWSITDTDTDTDTDTETPSVVAAQLKSTVVTGDQSLEPSPPPKNGLIEFREGMFEGLTEAQRLHWQGMFTFSIPDQVDRAAAWLQEHAAERDAIAKRGEGFGGFLIRWLLKEARTHGT